MCFDDIFQILETVFSFKPIRKHETAVFFCLSFFVATAFIFIHSIFFARNTMFNIRHDIKSKTKICNRKTCRGVTKNKSICLCISRLDGLCRCCCCCVFFFVVCFQLHFARYHESERRTKKEYNNWDGKVHEKSLRSTYGKTSIVCYYLFTL